MDDVIKTSEIKPPPLRRKSSAAFQQEAASSLAGGNVAGCNKKLEEKSKLEQSYIQMYLGELTPMQESELVQLKLRVSELLKGKVPSDPVFLRFLRARDFNVEKAREMLSQSMLWRKKHGVDKVRLTQTVIATPKFHLWPSPSKTQETGDISDMTSK